MRSTQRALVYRRIDIERLRQEQLFGRQFHAPDRWLRILIEEVGEVAAAIDHNDAEATAEELTQVAAVVVAWLEAGARSMPGLRVNLESDTGLRGEACCTPASPQGAAHEAAWRKR